MTPKERIKGVFGSSDSQIKFLQWFIGIGVTLSTCFSAMSYVRIEGINSRYVEVKEQGIKLQYQVNDIEKKVDKHSVQLDSISKRISILEVLERPTYEPK